MIKTLQKMGIEGNYLNIVTAIYNKSMANILNGGKLKHYPYYQEQDKGVHFHHYYSIILEVLATAIREENEIKGIQIGKEKIKLSLFADDMILYTENPKDSIRKLLELITEFLAKLQDTNAIHRNHLHFYILTMKNQKEKLRNQSHSPLQ